MMHQSYRNFHLFVAVKGMSSFIFQSILIPQFQEFIDEGRLTLRWFPNKNQLSNLADTIRGLDTTNYELFLKIDDDDFYGRIIFLPLMSFIRKYPNTIAVVSRIGAGCITNTAEFPHSKRNFTMFSEHPWYLPVP